MLYCLAMRRIQVRAGISTSTDKGSVSDPMGLDELTSYKWLGIGNGQVRT